MHPLISNAHDLSDSELQDKINEIYKRIRMNRNPELSHQLQLALETYQSEQMARYQKSLENDEDLKKWSKNISIE